jgi:hypothetical protein
MRIIAPLSVSCLAWLLAAPAWAADVPAIVGEYVEIRSCDVYTGPCFANAEMGLAGEEAVLAWSVERGTWEGVNLDGLKVVAVVKADGTLGDVRRDPPPARAVLIVDAAANARQRQALVALAKHQAGPLLEEVVRVDAAPIELTTHVASCPDNGCSIVRAKGLVEIRTRCLGGKDHVCGNEERYYPPLTKIDNARPAFTVVGLFQGKGLDVTFDEAGRRSAYLGTFGL